MSDHTDVMTLMEALGNGLVSDLCQLTLLCCFKLNDLSDVRYTGILTFMETVPNVVVSDVGPINTIVLL